MPEQKDFGENYLTERKTQASVFFRATALSIVWTRARQKAFEKVYLSVYTSVWARSAMTRYLCSQQTEKPAQRRILAPAFLRFLSYESPIKMESSISIGDSYEVSETVSRIRLSSC